MPSVTKNDTMESLPRKAKQRYFFATAVIMFLSAALALDTLYLRPGALSAGQPILAGLLLLLGWFVQASLGGTHRYYVEMIRNGCSPPPSFPNDPFGVRFLLKAAGHIKTNTLLAAWSDLFRTLGHTLKHRMFPGPGDTIMTDEPDNVRAVLSTRFDDWDLPELRIKAFLPVLGHYSVSFVPKPVWWSRSTNIATLLRFLPLMEMPGGGQEVLYAPPLSAIKLLIYDALIVTSPSSLRRFHATAVPLTCKPCFLG
ncbi:hypothetical protein PC116_g29142 [Phytophthora cactorum]|nr:hypothetical protein PC116_g29142 [Phytophthora cactorum]